MVQRAATFRVYGLGWTEGFEPSISWATTRCLRPLGYAHHGFEAGGWGSSKLEARGSRFDPQPHPIRESNTSGERGQTWKRCTGGQMPAPTSGTSDGVPLRAAAWRRGTKGLVLPTRPPRKVDVFWGDTPQTPRPFASLRAGACKAGRFMIGQASVLTTAMGWRILCLLNAPTRRRGPVAQQAPRS